MLIEFRPFRANSIKIQRGQERNQTMAKVRPIVEALEKHSHNQQRNSGQPLCADQPDEPLVGRPDGHLLQLRYANIWKSKSVPSTQQPRIESTVTRTSLWPPLKRHKTTWKLLFNQRSLSNAARNFFLRIHYFQFISKFSLFKSNWAVKFKFRSGKIHSTNSFTT